MADLFENPMGTDGFEFVEYAHPQPEELRDLFEKLGFRLVGRHKSKNVTLHRQGQINFIINAEPDSFAQKFAAEHGPCACAMAFRVKDAKKPTHAPLKWVQSRLKTPSVRVNWKSPLSKASADRACIWLTATAIKAISMMSISTWSMKRQAVNMPMAV